MAVSLTLGLSACAGGGGGSSKTVATIGGDTNVSQTMLNHWMTVVLGGDYQSALNGRSPEGLASEPADYPRCVAASEQIAQIPGKPKLTRPQRRLKCRQLHTAIEEQALGYLISLLWSREEAAELGLRAPTPGAVESRLRAFVHADFKSQADFRKVTAGEHRSLSDVRFVIKLNMLASQISSRIKRRAESLGGGERTMYKLVLQNSIKWQARTSCAPGYRTWECKQYGSTGEPGGEAKPPPAVVLEYFQKGIA